MLLQQGPTQQQESPRTRRKHSKVLTGCQDCKRRRLKCDEAKPACQRCQKANLVCSGYNVPQARIFEGSSAAQNRPSEESSLTLEASSFIPETPDLRPVWRKALISAFVTIWLPDAIIRGSPIGYEHGNIVPMSGWPLATWKLARNEDDDEDGIVAQSLLCLTLAVLGTRTNDTSLLSDASIHYEQVLRKVQLRVSQLAQTERLCARHARVAAIAAAGFCCSQVEYILQSWTNGDRHLEGMTALWQSCGPTIMEQEDTRQIFDDHCLLWTTCLVVHRRRAAPPAGIVSSSHSARHLVACAARLSSLLEDSDGYRNRTVPSPPELMESLTRIIDEIATYSHASTERSSPSIFDDNRGAETVDPPHDLNALRDTILTGYGSALILHAVATLWQIVESQRGDSVRTIRALDSLEEKLCSLCKEHLQVMNAAIRVLASQQFGMVVASPLLFFLNAAWIGHATLSDCGGQVILEATKEWFLERSEYATSIGYRPLREPWHKY